MELSTIEANYIHIEENFQKNLRQKYRTKTIKETIINRKKQGWSRPGKIERDYTATSLKRSG